MTNTEHPAMRALLRCQSHLLTHATTDDQASLYMAVRDAKPALKALIAKAALADELGEALAWADRVWQLRRLQSEPWTDDARRALAKLEEANRA